MEYNYNISLYLIFYLIVNLIIKKFIIRFIKEKINVYSIK